MMDGYTRGLIEGSLDSDGNLTIRKKMTIKAKRGWSADLKVRINNNSKKFLEKIQQSLNMGVIFQSNKNRGSWVLFFRQKEAKMILSQITLVVKEEQRKKYLNLLDLFEKRRKMPREEYEKQLQVLMD